MATSTTDIATIRANMVSAILGLSPSTNSSVKFKPHEVQEDFQAWAVDNPQAALRTYQIRNVTLHEEPDVSDDQNEERQAELEVMVAYPEQLGRYGADNFRSLDDVIEEDGEQLFGAIGVKGHANYPAGAVPTGATYEPLDENGVSFLRMIVFVTYYRDVS